MANFEDRIQFNRNYRLMFGASSNLYAGFLVDNLRIVFNIEKTLEQFPNKGTFDIYNLSKVSRSNIEDLIRKLQKAPRDGNFVIPTLVFQAGYRDNIKTALVANVSTITTRKVGPDIITTIEAADGYTAFVDAKLDVSFAPGTTAGQVLTKLLDSMGLSLGSVPLNIPGRSKGFNPLDQFLQGLTLSGSTKDHLTKLLKKQGLEWSIQDNRVQITAPDEPTPETALLLNRDTGLIDTPYRTSFLNDNLLKKKTSRELEEGIHALALLNADIKPGRLIALDPGASGDPSNYGIYKVLKMRHYGDTHGQPWYTDMVMF
jgi:hypothetical protein